MDTSEAVEDYLKAVYALQTNGGATTNARLAERLGVSRPSVSVMVKRLEQAALVERLPSGAVRLTAAGETAALRTVRRHRLIETYLHRCLAVPWDAVHEEAEVLEHAVSDRVEDRMAEALGHPTHDPHGDPIPPKAGPHREHWPSSLQLAPEGSEFVVERVSDRDPKVLRYLADLGIRPGTALSVEGADPFGGPLWVRVGGGTRRALGPVLVGSVFGSVAREGSPASAVRP